MSTRISASISTTAVPADSVADALERAVAFLLRAQTDEGYWLGELEGDTILESEYIILMRFLGRGDESKLTKAANYLRAKQMPNGGWSWFPGGPVDVSASVKAYLSLKMTGSHPDEPYMARAREAINNAGGVAAVNSYTRFYLAMLGQIPWNHAPAVPAEIMLLPNWFYFNIYAISSWSRTFVVPLSIIWARKVTRRLSDEMGIGELVREQGIGNREQKGAASRTWRTFFTAVDKLIKLAEWLRLLPLRELAVRRAEKWMVERFEHSSGLGAIFPPIVYSLIAMKALGYDDSDPRVERAMEELRKLEIEEDDTLRLQPCTSPVWDTAIVMNALGEARLDPSHPAMMRAANWILSKEVKIRGDWQIKRPNLRPGGWYFEFANDFYPDIDDTAMVLMALKKTGNAPGKDAACKRALDWLLGMQGRDGGWASFDVDNNRRVFNYIPFADHNAMLDPSTSDITARILEMFSFVGITKNHPAARRAIEFLRTDQEPDGSWYGRWGVNYIYGTWQSLRGLTRIGVDFGDPMVRRGAEWLMSVQNPDGGWGESCISYWEPDKKGRGESTPSQTAWAVMGLMSAGEAADAAVRRGIDYLVRTQNPDGSWSEEPFTGAGFPKVFYLKYHLYRQSFPTMALGMYRNAE
ncbi:MAG: squalene--hopene cyclase [Armatimonadetes bacterium]|nr:squalene--hopene cyclase [Armatimonadota bacterium]